MKEKMTVHKALCEIKVSDSRIANEIRNLDCVAANRANAKKVNGILPDEYEETAKRTYQSIVDLINRNTAIKRAISDYNARAIITVCGKEYTVAQAIYMMRNNMAEKRGLLNHLVSMLRDANDEIEVKNGDLLNQAAERNAQIQFGGDKSTKSSSEYLEFIEKYKEQNQYILVDPIGVLKKIEDLQTEIDEFMSNVDSAIQVSNATTEIEIEY